jgi:hypothetical protein
MSVDNFMVVDAVNTHTSGSEVPVPTDGSEVPVPKESDPFEAVPSTVACEVAEECVCPISQALMVDPVIAGDGHSYERGQIERWIRQQEADGHVPPRSPQTREPLEDTRLTSNVALRRAIERLINSGRLDPGVVQEWQAAKETLKLNAKLAKRDRSLAKAPLGTRIPLNVTLVARQDATLEEEINSGSRGLGDLVVDLHVAGESRGGRLFGGGGNVSPGRLLIANLSLGDAVQCLVTSPESDAESRITHLLEERGSLPLIPIPAETLIASVLPIQPHQRNGGSVFRGSSGIDCQSDTCLAVEHIVRRLASIPNYLPPLVQDEWKVLDEELHRRRRQSKLKELQRLLSGKSMKAAAFIYAVDHEGDFTLSFAGLTHMAQVPSDFIGTEGAVAQTPNAQRLGGMFGGERAHRGGLFGAPVNRSGGSLEGLDDSAAGVPITAGASPEQADTNAAGLGQGFSGQPAPNATVSGNFFGSPGANAAAESLFGQPDANTTAEGLFGQPGANTAAGGLFGQPGANVEAGGLFGQPGANTAAGGLFGQPGANTAAGGLFGQPGANTSAGGLFGQPGANSGGDLFGALPATQNLAAGLFGQPGTNEGGSLFGQPNANAVGGLFGQLEDCLEDFED